MGIEVEKLEDHGCPKVQDLLKEKMWVWSSYPFRHRTTIHSAERKAKLFDNCILHPLKS